MKGKRLFAVAGSLVAFGSIAGCSLAASPAPHIAKTAASAPVTITFWNTYSTTDTEESTVVKVLIPAFERSHPGIKVQNVTLPYGAMQTKLLTSAAGNQLPDVARLDIIWVPQLAKLGALMPANKQAGWVKLSKEVFPGPLSTTLYNGQYYGLPLDTNTKVLFSNPALLKKHGIMKPPVTMEQYITDIKKISGGQGKSKVYGLDLPGADLWQLLPWIASFGGSVLSPNMKTATGYLNGPKTMNAISTLVSLYKAGDATGILPGAIGDINGLAQGNWAFVDEGPWNVPTLAQQYPKFKYTMSLFPAGAGGSRNVVGGEDIAVFNTDPAHEKAAWAFEQFMMSPYAQTVMQSVGQMSTLKDLPYSKKLAGLTYFNIFRKQLATSVARPSVPNYSQVDTAITNEVTLAVQGKVSVKVALDTATQEVNQALK